ncbi:Flp family type IVb pilin [Bradyrhizobium genosp. P]|uniref:Flp family type IVb pilin n=1 Tax=Bradyrhizobium genosp. P TaxID=83641 RepID=UPI003CE8F333
MKPLTPEEARQLAAKTHKLIDGALAEIEIAREELIELAAIDRMRLARNVIPFPLKRPDPVPHLSAEAMAFARHRARQRLPYGHTRPSATVLQFVRDERGSNSIEYSLLATLVACALVAIIASLSSTLGRSFASIAAYLGGA